MATPDYLPLMQKFIPDYGKPLPSLVSPPEAAPPQQEDPGAYYNSLSPEQKKQIDLSLNPRGTFEEIMTGPKRGVMSEVPKRVGGLLQVPGKPGDMLYDWGTALQEYGKAKGVEHMADPSETAHNVVTRNIAEGGSQVAASVAVPAAVALGLAAAGASAPIVTAGAAAVGAGIIGGSAFSDTYKKAIGAGKTPEEARGLGQQTAVSEGLGEFLTLGVGGLALRGSRALIGGGGKLPVGKAIEQLKNPEFLKDMGKLSAKATAAETTIEAGQSYATAAIEHNAGIDPTDPYDAAVGSIGPTLGSMPWILPLAGLGLHARNVRAQKLVQQATAPDPKLSDSAQIIQADKAGRELQPVLEQLTGDPTAAHKWRLDQLDNLNKQHAATTEEAKQALAAQQAEDSAPQDQSELAGPGPGMSPEEYRQQTVSQAAAIPQPQPSTDPTTRSQYTQMFEDLLQERDQQEAAGRFWQQPGAAPTGPGGTTRPFLKTMEAMRREQNAPVQQTAPTPYAQSVEAMRQAQMSQPNQAAAKAVADVAAATTVNGRKAAVAQVLENPPEGALTFPQFVAEAQKRRKTDKGELKLKGGKATQGDYQDAYVNYVNGHLYQQEEQVTPTEVSPGQQAFDLTEAPSATQAKTKKRAAPAAAKGAAAAGVAPVVEPTVEPTVETAPTVEPAVEADVPPHVALARKILGAAPPTLVTEEMEQAMAGFGLEIARRDTPNYVINRLRAAMVRAGMHPAVPAAEPAPAAKIYGVPLTTTPITEGPLDVARTPPPAGAPRSAITPLHADAPLGLTASGRVTALSRSDLEARWQVLHGERKFNKQDEKMVDRAFTATEDYEGLAKQIKILRSYADKFKEGSPARNSLSSLVAEMETRHEGEVSAAQTAQLRSEDAIRVAKAKREVSRLREAGQNQTQGRGGVRQGEQGAAFTQGLAAPGAVLTSEVRTAADIYSEFTEFAKANFDFKVSSLRGQSKAALKQGLLDIEKQTTFEKQLAVLRATANKMVKKSKAGEMLNAYVDQLEQEHKARVAEANRILPPPTYEKPGVLVPLGEQLDVVDEKHRYQFERRTYDYTRDPGILENALWMGDYTKALKDFKDPDPQVRKHAAEAIMWVHARDPHVARRVQERQQRDVNIDEVNKRARDTAAEAAKSIKDRVNYEYEQLQKKGKLTAEDKADWRRKLDEVDAGYKARAPKQFKPKAIDPVGDTVRTRLALRQLASNMINEYEQKLGKDLGNMTRAEREVLRHSIDVAISSSTVYQNAADKIAFDEGRYDVNIEVAIRKGDLEGVLQAVEASEYSERMQPLVDRIRALGLKTKFVPWHSVTDPYLQGEVAKRMANSKAIGIPWLGTYFYNQDTVVSRNPSVHSVMHELNHAMQMARLLAARKAEKKLEWLRTSQEVELVKDLLELRKLAYTVKFELSRKKVNVGDMYAFEDEIEFLAEANSNEKFQDMLKAMTYKGNSIWRLMLEWMGRVLGRSDANYNNALEHAVNLSERFENPDMTGLTDSEVARLTEDVGPAADLRIVDRAVTALTSASEKALQAAAGKGNVGGNTTKAMLYMFTTRHIQKWLENSPTLAPVSESMKRYFAADKVRKEMIQNKTGEFLQPVRTIIMSLSGLNNKDRKAMEREISVLAMEMSGLNLDLNMGYTLNRQRNPNLEQSAAMRNYVDGLHQRYMALPQAVRTPLEHTFAVNRKNFIQQSTTSLRNYLKIRERTLGAQQVSRWLSRLDIRDPSLNNGTLPQQGRNRMPYYPDVYTKNLDDRLKRILQEVQQAHIGGEFTKIAEFYSAAVTNPYQHLGRMGNSFVDFEIRAGAQALAQVQQVLKPFNVVIGQPTAGNRHVFMRFESAEERNKVFKAIEALGPTVAGDLRGGDLEQRDQLQTARGVPDFAKTLHSNLDADFDTTGMTASEEALVKEMHQSIKRWALDAIPDTSARTALTSRNAGRTLGYEADFLRSYTTRAMNMTSMLTNSYSMPMYNEAFAHMKQQIEPLSRQDPKVHAEAQMVHDELSKRFINSLNPVESPIIDGAKAFGHHFFLALSPSFWLLNLLQPWHLTLPHLGSQYGFVKAGRAMGSATSKAVKVIASTLAAGAAQGQTLGGVKGAMLGILEAEVQTGTLTPGEAMFVREMIAAGNLESTQSREHELSKASEGTSPGMVAVTKFLSVGSHYTEVMNRLTAGLAGYNLEMAKSNNANKATAAGLDAVAETQFDHSQSNIGRAWGKHGIAGKYTPLGTSFQQYMFQATEFLLRLVRNATFPIPPNATQAERDAILAQRNTAQWGLAGVMGTTTLLAGSLGLPAVNVAAWLTDSLIDAMRDDDEKRRRGPSDVKNAWRLWLESIFGHKGGEIAAHGIFRTIGLEASARIGFQDIVPMSRFITDRRELKDKIRDGNLNMMGPAIGGGVQMALGLGKIFDGKIMEGLVQMAPAVVKGPFKAAQMYQEGGYTNTTGNKLPIEMDNWDILYQSLGFTPSPKAEHQEVEFRHKTRDMLIKQQKNLISNKLYRSYERNGTLTADEMKTLQEWNMDNPQYKIDLGSGLKSRAKERAVAAMSGTSILESPRYLPQLEQYRYAVTQ